MKPLSNYLLLVGFSTVMLAGCASTSRQIGKRDPSVDGRSPVASFCSWYERESSQGGMKWLDELEQAGLECPCHLEFRRHRLRDGRIVLIPSNPDPAKWRHPSKPGWGYHEGAAWCVRSKRATMGGHGQQCCYDARGRLITSGAAAGTPDKAAPARGLFHNLFSRSGHQAVDVRPYEEAWALDGHQEGEFVEMYLKVRPPSQCNCCKHRNIQ